MCGIAGILRVHPPGATADSLPPPHASIPDEWLTLLDAAVAHRGPDGNGRFRDRAQRADGSMVDVALVHRRLAIIDPATGSQPLITGDGPDLRATIFNGCIYNHRELRKELIALGRRFTTDHCDTEVVPHAHAQWSDEAPARMDGMFAYALWNRATADVQVVRDFAGEKPLYEATLSPPQGGSIYVFASTAAAVGRFLARFGREFGAGSLACSKNGLLDWLRFGGSLVPLLNEVDELDVRVESRFTNDTDDAGHPFNAPQRAWYADLPARRQNGKPPDALDVDALIARAVQSRLESDVPLGCFLSGGVDSSLVALHAKRTLGSLSTFTVQMPDSHYDESAFAQQAASVIGSNHTTLPCDARPAVQLPHLIAQLGLPFADSSLLPTYWVSTAARQHVKVALTGDAGDELFAGYERHAAASRLAQLHSLLAAIPSELGARSHPKSFLSKLNRLGTAARGGYEELLAVFPRPTLSALAPGLAPMLAQHPVNFPLDGPRHDFQWYLPGDLLRKADTASMSVALETRAPFLAREVIDFGLSTPLAHLTGGGRKGLLRSVARLHLPSEIVDRPKMGFAIPIGDWFRTDFGGLGTLLRDALNSSDPFPASLLGVELNAKFIARLMDEHMAAKRDHGQRLYLLLVLALWCRTVKSWSTPG